MTDRPRSTCTTAASSSGRSRSAVSFIRAPSPPPPPLDSGPPVSTCKIHSLREKKDKTTNRPQFGGGGKEPPITISFFSLRGGGHDAHTPHIAALLCWHRGRPP